MPPVVDVAFLWVEYWAGRVEAETSFCPKESTPGESDPGRGLYLVSSIQAMRKGGDRRSQADLARKWATDRIGSADDPAATQRRKHLAESTAERCCCLRSIR